MSRKKIARRTQKRPRTRAKVAPQPDKRKRAYTAQRAEPRQVSEIEREIRARVKRATHDTLDAAAANPEQFVNSLIGTFDRVKKARQMFKTNPAAAKSALALLALSNLAKLAKSKLG